MEKERIKEAKPSRGMRNNNPLNIRRNPANRWKGARREITDKQFEEFTTPFYGFRAAFILIYNYMKQGNNTIRKIITKWAPPSENDTQNYIRNVEYLCCIERDYELDFSDHARVMSLVWAMAVIETGHKYQPDVIDRAYWAVTGERKV